MFKIIEGDFKNQEYTGEVLPFSTTPQKTKKGFVWKIILRIGQCFIF